jgi:HK97 family phage major capsid protein
MPEIWQLKGKNIMSKLDELRLKRGQVVDQMKNLIDANQGDKWTDEIENSYQSMDADQTSIKNEIGRTEKQDKLSADLDHVVVNVAKSSHSANDKTGVSTPQYKDAFMNLMRVGKANVGHSVLNALEVGTASEGGNIVPTDLDSVIVEYLQDWNDFRQYVTVMQVGSDRDFPIETTLGSADWVAEEAAYNESDPAFGKASFTAHKLTRIVKVSEELVNDSVFDLMGYLGRNFGKSFGLAEEAAIVSGDNSGKPHGFNVQAGTGKTAAGATALTADELIDLQHSVARPYRRNAIFSMADATLAAVRKLKDGDGQYLWTAGLQAGQADMLLGKPVITSTAMPAMTSGLDAVSFGDLSYYYLTERGARQAQVLNELYAGTGQIGYRIYSRLDGALVDTNAVKNLTMA